MKRLPSSSEEWEHLAGAILKSELAMAGMNLIDLRAALLEIGIDQSTSNLSAKLRRGTFSAALFLQILVALDAEQLVLPHRQRGKRP